MTAAPQVPVRLAEAGDSALVLELESRIDPAVNARAIAGALALRAAAFPGVRDVVSTYRSVAVFFDPLQANLDALVPALKSAAGRPAGAEPSRTVEIPVAYGGENGPDLADVAQLVGLAGDEVIRRHTARSYRVYMLGFVPGFGYMGIVDEAIAVPRRSTPRVLVPAGSVAIASRQTGIYPQDSPGGWQLIGRTRVRPFDASRTPAFLFGPGDHVRFVPVRNLDETEAVTPAGEPGATTSEIVFTHERRATTSLGAEAATAAKAAASPERSRGVVAASAGATSTGTRHGGVTVVRPGLLTTVQDLGRWGYQDRGVPVAGPMDAVSHRLANAIVGNRQGAATLEATLLGPELRFDQDATFVITGADLTATLDGVPVGLNSAMRARTGAMLRFGERRSGARAYIACSGGFATLPVLGSRATHVLSRMGGLDGRPLVAGDWLPLDRPERGALARRVAARFTPRGGVRLRVLPGPQDDFFDAAAFDLLQEAHFIISPQSNRMAYRLTGGDVARATAREMISDATVFGGIQVPSSGEPILLMADRQTSGGYPQVATVITADLPLAAQLAPGDWVEFELCTRREAIAALIAQEGQLLALG